MNKSYEVRCVMDANAALGESTYWDPHTQNLWWIDIIRNTIYCYNPETGLSQSFKTPENPGCLALRASGGLVLSMTSGFYFFDPATGLFKQIIDPEADCDETRFNDGKTDRQGRFWSGSMWDAPNQKPKLIGSLYRLNADLTCHRVIQGIGCSNGLAWSPDSKFMYHTDSMTSQVWIWEFDPATGAIANRRLFYDLSKEDAFGDGATVDVEGCYWLTIPYKGKVIRLDPDGVLMETINLPTDLPTCCEFGGEELDTLYVTSASLNRSPEKLAGQKHVGGLFAIDVGVRGLAPTGFIG